MKTVINLFVKGIIIGIGKVIPGVSGSVIAIMLGIYEKGVCALNHFFVSPKKNLKFLFPTGLGILVSMIFGSKIILYILNKHYFLIMSLFCGLIFQTILDFRKQIVINKKDLIKIILISLIIFLVGTLNINNIYIYNFTFFDKIFLLFVGFIEAATMIIPGISGTAIMMILGVYNLILETFSNLYSLHYISYNLSILLPFFIGFILGFIIITRYVEMMIMKNKNKSYIYILGFIIGSFMILFFKTINYFNIDLFIKAILLFITGFIISFLFNDR